MRAEKKTSLTKAGYYRRARLLKEFIYNKQFGMCANCGFVFDSIGTSCLHHINCDITKNTKDNLIILCGSCHTKLHWDLIDHKNRAWKNSSVMNKFGISWAILMQEKKLRGIDINELHKWEEIKDKPGARYLGLGIGKFYKSKILNNTGFTGVEIASYLGVTRQCVNGLIRNNSPRIQKAVKEMRALH